MDLTFSFNNNNINKNNHNHNYNGFDTIEINLVQYYWRYRITCYVKSELETLISTTILGDYLKDLHSKNNNNKINNKRIAQSKLVFSYYLYQCYNILLLSCKVLYRSTNNGYDFPAFFGSFCNNSLFGISQTCMFDIFKLLVNQNPF